VVFSEEFLHFNLDATAKDECPTRQTRTLLVVLPFMSRQRIGIRCNMQKEQNCEESRKTSDVIFPVHTVQEKKVDKQTRTGGSQQTCRLVRGYRTHTVLSSPFICHDVFCFSLSYTFFVSSFTSPDTWMTFYFYYYPTSLTLVWLSSFMTQ